MSWLRTSHRGVPEAIGERSLVRSSLPQRVTVVTGTAAAHSGLPCPHREECLITEPAGSSFASRVQGDPAR